MPEGSRPTNSLILLGIWGVEGTLTGVSLVPFVVILEQQSEAERFLLGSQDAWTSLPLPTALLFRGVLHLKCTHDGD